MGRNRALFRINLWIATGLISLGGCKLQNPNSGLQEQVTTTDSGELLRWNISHPNSLIKIDETLVDRQAEYTTTSHVKFSGFGDSESMMSSAHRNGLIQVPIDLDVSLSASGSKSETKFGYTGSGWVSVSGTAKVRKNIWLFPHGIQTSDAYFTAQPNITTRQGSSASGRGPLGMGLFIGKARREAANETAKSAANAQQKAYAGLSTAPKSEIDKIVNPHVAEANKIFKKQDPLKYLAKDFDVFLRSVPEQAMMCIYDKVDNGGSYRSCKKTPNDKNWSISLKTKEQMLTKLFERKAAGKTILMEKLRQELCADALDFPMDFCNRKKIEKGLTTAIKFDAQKPLVVEFRDNQIIFELNIFTKDVPFLNYNGGGIDDLLTTNQQPIPSTFDQNSSNPALGQTATFALNNNAVNNLPAIDDGYQVGIRVTYQIDGQSKLNRQSIKVIPQKMGANNETAEDNGPKRPFYQALNTDQNPEELRKFLGNMKDGAADAWEQVELHVQDGTLNKTIAGLLKNAKENQNENDDQAPGSGNQSPRLTQVLGALSSLAEFHLIMTELEQVFAVVVHGPSLPLFVMEGVHKLFYWTTANGEMVANWRACSRKRLGLGINFRITPAQNDPNYNFVKVTHVHPDTPAAKAGIQVGDFIDAVNGMHYGTELAFKVGIDDLSTYTNDFATPITVRRQENGVFQVRELSVNLRSICPELN